MCAHDITHYLPIPGQSVTYRHNVHVQSLRTCLFSSDAAQWWPGVWGWTGPAGHGLDKGGVGTSLFVPGVPLWGSAGGRVQA
jgi:hypothetical protein